MKHIYNTDNTGLNNAAIYDRGVIEDKISDVITEIMDILGNDYPSVEIEMYIIEEVMDKFLQARIDKRTKLLRKEKSNE